MKQHKTTIYIFLSIILLIILLLSTGFSTNAFQDGDDINFSNAIIVSNQTIGNKQVYYYEHIINNVTIKNDYLLRHYDIETQKLSKETYQWTTEENLPFISESIQPPEIKQEFHWTKPVLFLQPSDLKTFYDMDASLTFPVLTWETRHLDGTTILYNETGSIIGTGIPAPFDGHSLSGYHEPSWPDPWIDFRLNANSWFQQWCDNTNSVSLPTPSMISLQVSNEDNFLFYELAHGSATYFQADSTGSYYTSSMTEADMQHRDPFRFAFIGSCHGMVGTGPGTFSHEFRKGSMTDTVTIGYDHMEECPGWSDALPWQDYMFYAMNNGFTIKEAFDLATAEYPAIEPAVVFVGDESITIQKDQNGGDGSDIIPPRVFITYPPENAIVQGKTIITGTSDHLNGYVTHIYLKIGDSSWIEADGTYNWEYVWDTTLVLDGSYLITAIAKDNSGISSGCTYRRVTVANTPLHVQLQGPTNALVNQPISFEVNITEGTPPYIIEWDFGDGAQSTEPTHIYTQPGSYQITVEVTDNHNKTGRDSYYIQIRSEDVSSPEITLVKPTNHFIINDIAYISWRTPLIFGPFTVEAIIHDESMIDSTILTFNGNTYPANPLNSSRPEWFITEISLGKQLFTIESIDIHGNTQVSSFELWKFI